MSQRIPGYSQHQMDAEWTRFVKTAPGKTNFKTAFNGKSSNVYRDENHLFVLDEYHGDLEVLAMQNNPGPAKHLGSQEIDLVSTSPIPQFKRGKYKNDKPPHRFVLFGSL